jgi:hypothetical protein
MHKSKSKTSKRQHVSFKIQYFHPPKRLNKSNLGKILNNEFKRTMTIMSNEIKEEMYKHLNGIKEDTNT